MRVILPGKPFHQVGFSTPWIASTPPLGRSSSALAAIGLFVLVACATLMIFVTDPFVSWGYELGIFLLGGYCSVRQILDARVFRLTVPAVALAAMSLWGFAQLSIGATVYRYATWDESLRVAACGATAWVGASTLGAAAARLRFLRALAYFGGALSLLSVVAYYTSPGRVMWIFASPYPDIWGPFLSRNDFAGFMELSFPVALWLALDGGMPVPGLEAKAIPEGIFTENRVSRRFPLWVPAWMLAAGLASGSRAGAILLLAEAGLILRLLSQRRAAAKFVVWAALLAAAAGGGTLAGRFAEKDPWRYRREIASSTFKMIADHPWRGYGQGTYAYVYPAYAAFDVGARVEHAHNYWLEWAAEGGIPLALIWLALAIGVSGPAIRSVWGLGILAAFLHALVDYPFARLGLAAWDFALIGALSAARVRKAQSPLH